MPHQQGIKAIAQNRKAFHDYFVEEKVECGIALFGTEVKSIRLGKVNLKESWAQILDAQVMRQGFTLIPLEIYLKNGLVKIQLGLCKCKQLHDKRDSMAKRDSDREIRRVLKEKQK